MRKAIIESQATDHSLWIIQRERERKRMKPNESQLCEIIIQLCIVWVLLHHHLWSMWLCGSGLIFRWIHFNIKNELHSFHPARESKRDMILLNHLAFCTQQNGYAHDWNACSLKERWNCGKKETELQIWMHEHFPCAFECFGGCFFLLSVIAIFQAFPVNPNT